MIATFVFFDLETTGLIQGNIMPNITEMSLVAVTRNNLLNTVDELPRVLPKLVLPIHPKLKIPRMVELYTNLSNENLKEAQCFDQGTYNLIRCFLNQLNSPICFVAHNGIKFDYPVLLHEIRRINETFSDNVLCIDTLHLFKEFFSQNMTLEKDTNTVQTKPNTPTSFMHKDLYCLLNDGHDNELIGALDKVMVANCTQKIVPLSESKNQGQPLHGVTHADCYNEQSLDHFSYTIKTPSGKSYSTMRLFNEKTPEGQIIKSDKHTPYGNGKHVRRKLNFMHCKPPNFKLGTLYTHMLGATAKQLHTAEGDCLTMLCCAVKIATFFVEWADLNALPLVNCKK